MKQMFCKYETLTEPIFSSFEENLTLLYPRYIMETIGAIIITNLYKQ